MRRKSKHDVIHRIFGWADWQTKKLLTCTSLWLNKRTAGFSRNSWKAALAAFLCVSTMLCGKIIWTSRFQVATNLPHSRKAEGIIQLPLPVVNLREQHNLPASLQKFQLWTDSMARTPEGRDSLDSLRSIRPGLFDSLELVRHLYETDT